MAKLVNCKSCGKEIAKGAKSCPNCGAKQKKNKVLIGLCVLIALGIIGSLGGKDDTDNSSNVATNEQNEQSAPVSTEQNEQPAQAEPKVDPMVVTTDELLDALDANALNASKTYKDKYVEMTGVLSTIDSSGKYFTLTRNDGELTFINVMCYINKEQVDTVASFVKEQEVTVVGTISEVGEVMGYSLKVESIK